MKGNCVDKFVNHRCTKRINELLKIRYKIRERVNDREQLMDYFDSGCYEKDFSDIIELRNKAQELVNNCNDFLEKISEQYSKLN